MKHLSHTWMPISTSVVLKMWVFQHSFMNMYMKEHTPTAEPTQLQSGREVGWVKLGHLTSGHLALMAILVNLQVCHTWCVCR